MASEKLTDFVVKHAVPPAKGRAELWDSLLPGFGLRMTSAGAKSWVVMYRFEGTKRRLTFGNYPKVSLKDARTTARDALNEVSHGRDPGAAKVAARLPQAPRDTIEHVINEFMKRYMAGKERSPRYIQETRRNFDLHVIPRWKGRELAEITRRDILAMLDAIVDAGKPVAANRVLAAVRKLFNWSIQRGIIETSPATLVQAPGAEVERDRALTDSEIALLWEAAAGLGYPFGPYFMVTLLTGQRRSEVAGMRWDELDMEAGLWTIPASRTKAGRAHVVPLPYLTRRILKGLPEAGTHVFTTRNKRRDSATGASSSDAPISGFSKAKRDIDAAILALCSTRGKPIPAAWTIHDLRRTASTGMARGGVPRFVLGRVINHADQTVTGIYDRYEYLTEKRHALRKWGLHLAGLVKGAKKSNR